MRLCALVSDGHTNVYPPEKLNILSKPPLRTGLIEGHVMILEVMSPALDAQGLRPGMEIVSVDGQPALHYVKREVEPYQSASTSQDRELRILVRVSSRSV
jgi:carboxyl-terminal processing protease